MTDEERESLCGDLLAGIRSMSWLLTTAAEEIERLEKRCNSAEAALRHALQHCSSNTVHPIEQEARYHFKRWET